MTEQAKSRNVYDLSDIIHEQSVSRPVVVKTRDEPRASGATASTKKSKPAAKRADRVQPAGERGVNSRTVPLRAAVRKDVHQTLKLRAINADTNMSALIRDRLDQAPAITERSAVRAQAGAGYVLIQVMVDSELHRRLKVRAMQDDVSLVDFLAGAITELAASNG